MATTIVLLTYGDGIDAGIMPLDIAIKQGREIANQTGLPVRLRDTVTDKVLRTIKPNGAAR